nr:MAG TPA: hypothetical protein [Caudoviricetes sp.]DAP89822.1 MAG TPA: hypothetical protein [Caudoviricetes sp.]
MIARAFLFFEFIVKKNLLSKFMTCILIKQNKK